MSDMKVILVGGARPNFVKIYPLMRAIREHNSRAGGEEPALRPILVHTGQHYDYEVSQVFFENLELPAPDIYLNVGSGTHAEQTGRVLVEFEKVLFQEKPDLVMVVGDVNSTIAGALAAVKLNIPVAHVEAGLRCFDNAMPEEINRLLTDAISDYLFTHSPEADENLEKEGIPREKVFFVGNVMIDTLLSFKDKAEASDVLSRLKLDGTDYALMTLHRPANVDITENLRKVAAAVRELSPRIKVVFPVHPRTRKNIREFGLESFFDGHNVLLTEPLGYLDFLKLMSHARLVMTDSGGIQEETTVLNVPCLTLRETTERPVTVAQGTSVLVGNDTGKIVGEALKILSGQGKRGTCPELWDGKAAPRIIKVIASRVGS